VWPAKQIADDRDASLIDDFGLLKMARRIVIIQDTPDFRSNRSMSRIHLSFLVCCLLALAIPRFFGQQAEEPQIQPKDLHLYLLIGQSNMAGRAAIPEDARDT